MKKNSPLTHIIIKNAYEHNLKNLTLEIPKNKLIVITGVSGSGKSTLAFDTIYAEGQRKYIESLSSYARQFLDMMDKPKVDKIEGLSPAISIDQKTTSKNPRSTVGTVTEIYDYLRVLYARLGVPYSPATGKPIKGLTSSEIIEEIQSKFINKKIIIMSPIIKGRKGEYKKIFEEYFKKGYERFYVNNKLYEKKDIPELSKNFKHTISIVIDRIIPSKDNLERAANSVEICLNESEGNIEILDIETNDLHKFSNKFMCPVSGFSIDEIEPRIFSFNNPYGACKKCDGLGEIECFDEDLLVPDKNLSFNQGSINFWSDKSKTKLYPRIKKIFDESKSSNTLWSELSEKIRNEILYGNKDFDGLIHIMDHIYDGSSSWWRQWELEKFRSSKPCSKCDGMRLNEKSLCVKIKDLNISQFTQLSIEEARNWIATFDNELDKELIKIAEPLKKEIFSRLEFLNEVGLGYLSISRKSGTLSGGESQRIRLASQIGSGLTGVTYVLDEPSIGLHQKDNHKLIKTLKNLRELGNTIIVVEHDEDIIREADHVIDIGKFAGKNGGKIIYQGSYKKITANKESLTNSYLLGAISRYKNLKNTVITDNYIKIEEAEGNNLKKISVNFPLTKKVGIATDDITACTPLISESLNDKIGINIRNENCDSLTYPTNLANAGAVAFITVYTSETVFSATGSPIWGCTIGSNGQTLIDAVKINPNLLLTITPISTNITYNTFSKITTHELLELIVNPTYANYFLTGNPQNDNAILFSQYETCDPVEAYSVIASNRNNTNSYSMSPFVMPTYFHAYMRNNNYDNNGIISNALNPATRQQIIFQQKGSPLQVSNVYYEYPWSILTNTLNIFDRNSFYPPLKPPTPNTYISNTALKYIYNNIRYQNNPFTINLLK